MLHPDLKLPGSCAPQFSSFRGPIVEHRNRHSFICRQTLQNGKLEDFAASRFRDIMAL